MNIHRREVIRLAAAAAALPALPYAAKADTYPARPVSIVVGYAPGGVTDIIARLIGPWLSERLGGDPLWLLLISGPGAAKTETVQSLSGAGAYVTSTITSEGALLSATSQKGRTKTATGGLLRKIGERGVLVIKDVTSILSADRNLRGGVLAAIREIYDGRWERNVGTDGGQTLTWTGRIVIVGAVTTAWDAAHAVVAAMGDRFVLIRINSKQGRGGRGYVPSAIPASKHRCGKSWRPPSVV
jgi:hypothetical protein